MSTEHQAKIAKIVQDENVKHIQLWFTDILGNLKMVEVPDRQLHNVLESGAAFDGSSISGYAEIEESDIVAMPDWSTFTVLPWAQGNERTAFVFCDVLDRDYKPFEGDPRWVLRRQLERAQKLGLNYYVGPELEYFYFKSPEVREFTSVVNQYVNSYKRLVPGYEAPVYISWAHRNRTALIRVPLYVQGKESTVRAELRNPDPAANPYLAFAVMLAAGLEGIEKGYELPPSVEPNIYKMTADEREVAGLGALPNNLYEAITETQQSELVRRTLGDHVFERFVTNKLNEWYEYREQVTDWEVDKYFSKL